LATALAEEVGASVAPSLKDLTAGSDIILTVVTDDRSMDADFFGEDNLLENAVGKVFVNCATVSPDVHRKIDAGAQSRGASSLEACMASSIPQARNGELYLMIGGSKEVFDQIKPLLDDLSKKLLYIGESGKAAEVKALANMVMNINTRL
jgi:3-hydroxyisobutyrate dehydrogenase